MVAKKVQVIRDVSCESLHANLRGGVESLSASFRAGGAASLRASIASRLEDLPANLRVCKAQSRVESSLANLPGGLEVCKQTCGEGRKFTCKIGVQGTRHLSSSTTGGRNSFRPQNPNSLRNEKDKTTKNSPQRQKRC